MLLYTYGITNEGGITMIQINDSREHLLKLKADYKKIYSILSKHSDIVRGKARLCEDEMLKKNIRSLLFTVNSTKTKIYGKIELLNNIVVGLSIDDTEANIEYKYYDDDYEDSKTSFDEIVEMVSNGDINGTDVKIMEVLS